MPTRVTLFFFFFFVENNSPLNDYQHSSDYSEEAYNEYRETNSYRSHRTGNTLCSGVNTDIEYVITGEEIDVEDGSIMIHLSSKYKFDLRLDKVLLKILGISRSKLYQMADQGRIVTNPQVSIKSKLREDLQISIVAL